MAQVASIPELLADRRVWHAGQTRVPDHEGEDTGFATLDAILPQGGWPRGALTELLLPGDGVGELSLLAPVVARVTQAGGDVALVAPPYLPYAPAWQAMGVNLKHLHVIEADAKHAAWAFEQTLRSGCCQVVVGWPQASDMATLRRLQVAADSGACMGFALRDRKHLQNPSPATLRLECVAQATWQVRKCKGAAVPQAVVRC